MKKSMFMLAIGFTLLAIVLILMTSEGSEGADVTVPGDYPTIIEGYENCSTSDRLLISAGEYTGVNIVVDKEIDIIGVGTTTNITGTGSDPVFTLQHDNSSLQYLKINGGNFNGVLIEGCNDTDLYDVTVASSVRSGVNITGGFRHVIRNCNISSNDWFGIIGWNYYSGDPIGNFNIYNNDIRTNERDGLALWECSHTTITNNNVSSNNQTAISLRGCNNLSISENHIYSNGGNGIYLDVYSGSLAYDNEIWENTIVNQVGSGVYNRYGNRAYIHHNYIYACLQGVVLFYSDNCNISSNDIFSSSSYGLSFSQATYVDVYDNYINQSAYGDISLNVGRYINITCNTFEDGGDGTKFFFLSGNCTFIGNTIYNNATPGYLVKGAISAHDVTVSDNVFYSNADYGVSLQAGDRWIISNNQFIGEIGTTIYLYGSDYAEVSNCTFSNNTIGAYLMYSNNCTFSNNTFEDCTLGIKLDIECYDTWIYGNEFINNTVHAQDGINTLWYDPIRLRGNYWDTYVGLDMDGDGVGDTETPYLYDPYPLTDNVPPPEPPTRAEILHMAEIISLFTFLVLIAIVVKFKKKTE